MNSTYRSIWNESLGAWVAASELCSARGKKSTRSVLAAGLLATAALGGASSAWAVNECGMEAAGADTLNCAAAAYPAGIVYTNSDGLTLNLDNPAMVVGATGAQVISSAANTNSVTVNGLSFSAINAPTGYGILVRNNGTAGDATATLTAGAISTADVGAHGLFGHVANAASTGTASVQMLGGAVSVTGQFANGIAGVNQGLGAANASMTGGSIATTGENGFAIHAHVANTASTATATAIMDGAASTITTQQVFGHGVYAENSGMGAASATLLNGSISTLGETAHGVFAISNNTVPGSVGAATARMEGGSISTAGLRGYGIYAENLGLGASSATQTGGTIATTGDNAYGLYSLVNNTASAGSTAATMAGGSVTTDGLNGYGVYAATSGTGASTATLSAGDIVTLSDRSHGVTSVSINFGSTAASTAAVTGGTITTGTVGSYGAYATTVGRGSANALMTAGTISTTGVESHGIAAAALGGASTASANTVMNGGSIATSGSASHGLSSQTAGSGMAQVAMSAGNVAATGLNSDGLRATSAAGSYNVDVVGGNLAGGSGTGAAIHTLAAAGGTVDIGTAATVNGAASGIAIRDGDAAGTGTDALGGNAVVTTAGTVTGDALLGLGNDSLALAGGSFTGNIYGDDRVASAADGNDSFTWTGGTLTGGFFGQNGSDSALVSAPGYTGSTVLNGGDDVSAADGWVDKLILQGVTATAGGAQLVNWETIHIENARLTLAGAPLVVGAGADASGAPMGLFVNSGSSLLMGQPAFAITGDLHNSGLVDLRNPSGVPGNVLTVNGNYAGTNGLVNINTALGGDASATDKLVVNGNTSGTTRVQVNNTGGAGAQTVNGIQVVQVNGTSSVGNFTLASPVQAGAYEYGLHRGGNTDGDANSFYLGSAYLSPPMWPLPDPPVVQPQPEVWRPAVPGYVLGQVASNELGLGLLGSLHKRVGEQQTFKWDHCGCDDKAPADQVWGRLHAQRVDIDGKRQFGSEQNLQFVQFGKDLSIAHSGDPGDKSRTHTGLSMGYGRTTTDFNDRRRGDAGMGYDTGKMKGQMATLGAYHTRYADNGSYLDLVGQLHAVHNKYTDKYGGEGTQKGAGFGLSAEVGRPWQIGESQWLIEPQAQLSYQATRYRGFSDDVSSVDGFTGQSLRARLGGRLAWNDKADRADKLTRTNTFYVTANLLHEFMDPETVTVGGTSVSEDWAKKTWAEIGVGAQLPLSKSTYLYGGLQYQRSLGDRSREGVSGQLGVRVAW